MNFCVAISRLKIEGKKINISGILLLFSRKVKIQLKCNKGFVQHSCCDGPKVSKVVSEVLCWRFVSESMVDGLVDPVEVDSYQIEILIVNNQCGR